MRAPVAAIQTRAVLSLDAVTIRLPSGLNAADLTEPACPLSSAMRAPVSAIQTRAVLSPDAVTMRLPSGLNAADLTGPACPLSSAMRAPGVGHPDPRRLIPRRGDDAAALRAERGGTDIARMFENRVHARHFADEKSQTLAHRHLIEKRTGHCLDRTGEQMHGVQGIPLE